MNTNKKLIKINTPELQVIEKSKAEQIKQTFEPMIKMLEEFEASYNEVITLAGNGITNDLTAKAKKVRVSIAKVRIETEKIRKAQKEEYLRAGKAIDGVANILKWAVIDKENKLKEIEKYFEIQEQKRLEKLQNDRAELLSKYVEDAHDRDLASMDDDVWDSYLFAKKKAYEDRIEAERKAEQERIAREKAEAVEREKIREENERLKREARKRENLEREERAKREKLEAELRVKEEAEQKVREDEEAKIQAELNKGDSAKVKDLIKDLENLKSKYIFKSKKNNKMYDDVNVLLEKIIIYIKKR